ncbi:Hypothetical predicted protein [Cloeon dipterum]|uniref:BTB domain-containing protein n=1 Tax=Cloeon dipterum TaxID=197152 RepID=A0A8S1C278_9INSE|nr:Hypothetical predicted protein [Cloeon dipterum]
MLLRQVESGGPSGYNFRARDFEADWCYKQEEISKEERCRRQQHKKGFLDGNEKLLYGIKSVLQEKSKILGELISKFQEEKYVEIEDTNARIFRSILEHCHTGEIGTGVETLNDCIELATAAEKFGLRELGQEVANKLITERFLDEQNVWKIFNNHLDNQYVSSACKKLLVEKTESLLARTQEFLTINVRALQKFLSFDEMNIDSELSLVKACFQYAKEKSDEESPEKTFKEFFRKDILPGLRLLTVKTQDLKEIADCLNMEEKKFLIHKQHQYVRFLSKQAISPSDTINKNSTPRKSEPKCLMLGLFTDAQDVIARADYKSFTNTEFKSVLSFVANECVEIKDFEIFCPLDESMVDNVGKSSDEPENGLQVKIHQVSFELGTKKDNLKVRVIVHHRGCEMLNKEVPITPRDSLRLNEWITIKQNVVVPKKATLTLEVIYGEKKGRRIFRRNGYKFCSTEKDFKDFELQLFKKEEAGDGEFKLVLIEEDQFNIFKQLHYKKV